MVDKDTIMAGRKAVDVYRAAHAGLCLKPWHRGIPEEHTPLLNTMMTTLNSLGFNSLSGFFFESGELNVKELGFADKKDFKDKAKDTDKDALDRMWR